MLFEMCLWYLKLFLLSMFVIIFIRIQMGTFKYAQLSKRNILLHQVSYKLWYATKLQKANKFQQDTFFYTNKTTIKRIDIFDQSKNILSKLYTAKLIELLFNCKKDLILYVHIVTSFIYMVITRHFRHLFI